MKMARAWAQPSAWTFTIPQFADLIKRYVGDGKGWIDPFAGFNSPAEFTNDMNPDARAKYHMEAVDFCNSLSGPFKGVLFDPPYSYRQVSEHYNNLGMKATQENTSSHFYGKVKNAICNKIILGGFALSFGWDSNGFGKTRGFEIIEILLIAHGGHHHDTICTVEKKVQSALTI
jgi:hypothetical protein